MRQTVIVPKLGLTMEEAVLVEWQRADGDRVARGDTLVGIETDKIVYDVEAEHDGYLQRVAEAGTTLPVGAVMGYLHPTAEEAAAPAGHGSPPTHAPQTQTPAAAGAGPVAPSVPSSPSAPPEPEAPHPATLAVPVDAHGRRLLVSPVARVRAQNRGVDLRALTGSGPGGVILLRDVETAQPQPAQAEPVAAAAPKLPPEAVAAPRPMLPATATRTPLSPMRKAVARRMMQSLATKAQMTGFGRVDMAEARRLRDTLVAAEQDLGARITYTDLVLKAAASVLAEMPQMNAYIEGDEVVTLPDIDIGLAVSLDGGLIVPVLRQVDRLSLVELSLARQALIAKARSGRLAREDVEGGSFTLSNFGSYGGDFETPILNAPQSALLGIGRISDEAVVREGQIVVRPMMSISLTFDHCLIDGAMAGDFRARFRARMEQPGLLLARLR